MQSEEKPRGMPGFLKGARRWIPGALISILLIGAILHFVDLPKVFAAIRSANYGLLAVATVLAFAWMFVRAVVWRSLLRNRPPYRDTLLALSEGYLLNNFLPFRLGEIGRAFLLSRKTDLAFAEILPTVVIERAVDLFFSAAIFLGALPFVVGAEGAGRIAILLGIVIRAWTGFPVRPGAQPGDGAGPLPSLERTLALHAAFWRQPAGIVPGRPGRADRRVGVRAIPLLDVVELGDGHRQLLS